MSATTVNDALAGFLADPTEARWILSANQGRRTHVEWTIRASEADVDATTLRQGRPHKLVCTKNTASYDRRVAQRRRDLEARAALQAMGEPG